MRKYIDKNYNVYCTEHNRLLKYNKNTMGYICKKCQINDRLEYLRAEIKDEQISYGEIAELQSLAKHIPPGDIQLLEFAGIRENTGI